MIRRDLLKCIPLAMLSMIYPINIQAKTIKELYPKKHSISFFSSGDQVLVDHRGIILKKHDGKYLFNKNDIDDYLTQQGDISITLTTMSNKDTIVDFNKITYIRKPFKKSGNTSTLTVTLDDFGKMLSTDDSFGRTIKYLYGKNGNLSKRIDSAYGTSIYAKDGKSYILESLDGTKETFTTAAKAIK